MDIEKKGELAPQQLHKNPAPSARSSSFSMEKPDPNETEAYALPQTDDEPQGDVKVQEEDSEKASGERGGKGPDGPPQGIFDPRQNPDGGTKAWLSVVGGFCALFASFGWINCIGVFQDHYQRDQLKNLSPSTISWIPSLEAFMMFFGGPIIGKLYDNYGPRWILITGTFLHVFGLMMTSLSTKYYQFVLAQGICSAIGASMCFYPAMSVASTWFFKKRALAFGLMAAGSSIGGVVIPIMVQKLLPRIGFGWTMRSAAFLLLGMLIIANVTITSRIPPSPKPVELKEFFVPLTEIPFLLVTIGSFLFFLGMFLPINFLIVQARDSGMNPTLAGYLISILNAVSLFGRIIPGYIADKLGRFNIFVIMCTFTFIIDLALWIPAKGIAPIIVFAALYGFGSGAFVSMAPAIIAQITPDIRKIGVRTGTLFAIISVAALIGNPIGGALVQARHGGFLGLQLFCGIMQAAGTICMLLARIKLAGLKLKVKV